MTKRMRLDLGGAEEPQEPDPIEYSDDALAQQFADEYREEARYVVEWGRWMLWNGRYWARDEKQHNFTMARRIARRAAALCKDKNRGEAKAISSNRTVAAIVHMSGRDERIAATIDQWDKDPWLLNTPKCTIDLRDGERCRHNPDDNITRCTSVSPDPACEIPNWLKFIDSVTDGDKELQAYLQRCAGYSLTGITSEHALFFLWGTGFNGKSTFLDVLDGILKDYAATAPVNVFLEKHFDAHPTELAALKGARYVRAGETAEGQRWSEGRIKMLTGEDRITARFMRQDDFTFTPEFKLWIASNHKPELRVVDEAIKGRMHMIPFTVSFFANGKDRRDRDLRSKLEREKPGILQWMIDGCLAWQKQGLAQPTSVRDATNEYMRDEDTIGRWLEECCEQGRTYKNTSSGLFESYKAFCDRSKEQSGSQKAFSLRLKDKFEWERKLGGVVFHGVQTTERDIRKRRSS